MAKTIRAEMPQIHPIPLGEALAKYKEWQRAQGMTESTIKTMGSRLNRLAREAGAGKYVHTVDQDDFTRYMGAFRERGQGTRNQAISNARGFFTWARRNQHTSPFEWDDPSQGWSQKTYETKHPDYVPPARWGELLDIAEKIHPSHRIIVALGLYVLQRGPSEMLAYRLSDLNLNDWKIRVTRRKTKGEGDWMPICGELRIELTRWLALYNTWCRKHMGRDLAPTDYLVPRAWYSPRGHDDWTIRPDLPCSAERLPKLAEKVFAKFGLNTRNEDGSRNRLYGSHAWRKIGARALFDELMDTGGYDGALAVVREMLGHKSNTTTEHYLNLSLDKTRRDRAITQNNGFMYAHNDPSQRQTAELSARQLPASLVGGVELGGAAVGALAAADSAVNTLPAFLRKAA